MIIIFINVIIIIIFVSITLVISSSFQQYHHRRRHYCSCNCSCHLRPVTRFADRVKSCWYVCFADTTVSGFVKLISDVSRCRDEASLGRLFGPHVGVDEWPLYGRLITASNPRIQTRFYLENRHTVFVIWTLVAGASTLAE